MTCSYLLLSLLTDPLTQKHVKRKAEPNTTNPNLETRVNYRVIFLMIPMVHPYGSSPTIRIPKPSSNQPYSTEAVVFWGGLFGMITVPVFTVWGPMIWILCGQRWFLQKKCPEICGCFFVFKCGDSKVLRLFYVLFFLSFGFFCCVGLVCFVFLLFGIFGLLLCLLICFGTWCLLCLVLLGLLWL